MSPKTERPVKRRRLSRSAGLCRHTNRESQDFSSFPFQIRRRFRATGGCCCLTPMSPDPIPITTYTPRNGWLLSRPDRPRCRAGIVFRRQMGPCSGPCHLHHLRIIPTGVGESRSLSAPSGRLTICVGTWMPDGKHILMVASAAGHSPVSYLQDIPSGAAHQITQRGTVRGELP